MGMPVDTARYLTASQRRTAWLRDETARRLPPGGTLEQRHVLDRGVDEWRIIVVVMDKKIYGPWRADPLTALDDLERLPGDEPPALPNPKAERQ